MLVRFASLLRVGLGAVFVSFVSGNCLEFADDFCVLFYLRVLGAVFVYVIDRFVACGCWRLLLICV